MQWDDVPVRGAYHRGKDIADIVRAFEPGQRLTLEREPMNEYDNFAIKVLCEDVHIGYVAKEIASWIAPHMDAGEEFEGVMTHVDSNGRNSYPMLTISDAETVQALAEDIETGSYKHEEE